MTTATNCGFFKKVYFVMKHSLEILETICHWKLKENLPDLTMESVNISWLVLFILILIGVSLFYRLVEIYLSKQPPGIYLNLAKLI